MEVHVCLENCDRGLFITPAKVTKWHKGNPRVEKELENKILGELKKARFEQLTDDMMMAATQNFNFKKYTENNEDEIIWVEPHDESFNTKTL